MQEITLLTIGLALLSFLLGAIIVGLALQSRSRRLQEAHTEQVRRLREEERRFFAAFEGSEASRADVESRLDETKRSLEAGARETEILRAQFQEEQEAAYGLEDRLNAAEARLLSADAELAENRLEMQRWDSAYSRLKESHVRLADAHHQARMREEELARTLSSGSGELETLQSRLDLLQASLSLALHSSVAESEGNDPAARFPAQLRELALAKVDVQAELRRREDELTSLRSQLAATRFSLNVLAKSGAELASRFSAAETYESVLLPTARYASTSSAAAQEEQLASLEGMIADWFEEMRGDMPYGAQLLRTFSGMSSAGRFAQADTLPGAVEGREGELQRAPDLLALEKWLADTEQGAPGSAPKITHDVMLAAVKAASVSALRRSRAREDELLIALGKARLDLDELQESIALQGVAVVEDLQESASLTSAGTAEEQGATESINGGEAFGSIDTGELDPGELGTDKSATDETAIDVAVEEIPVLELTESVVLAEADATAEDFQSHVAANANQTTATDQPVAAPVVTSTDTTSAALATGLAGATDHRTESAPALAAVHSSAAVIEANPAQATKTAGIPRADVPMPATPKPSLPMPAAPGPAAARADETPQLRTAWGRFVRRVETVLQRPPGRK